MNDIKTIVAAVDLSDTSRTVLESARDLARRLDAQVRVVHVVHDMQKYMGFYIGAKPLDALQHELESEARDRVRRLAAELFDDAAPEITIVKGTPYSDLSAFVRDASGDLLVVGAHGLRKPEHQIFGSTAERLLKAAPCPVLVVGQK